LKTACFLAFILLIVATASAQNHTPSKISGQANDVITTADGSGAITAVPANSLPQSPTPHRVIDKKFILVMGALGAAESMRFTSRKLVLDNEFAAGAPWVTHVPSNQHLVAEYAGLYAAELLVAYELKKPHSWLPGGKVIRKLWWAYPAAMMAIHIKNGVGSIRTQAPSCPVADCPLH
jgi:hypothetical protein